LRTARILALSIIAAVAGCSGNQSALDPQGAPAIHVEHLIIGITVICTVVWLLVMFVLGWALLRKRSGDGGEARERPLTMSVGSAVAATVMIIAGLTIASFYTTRGIGLPENAALTITVRGQQWWWQVIYADANPALSFQTSNVIHIPVGQDVRIELDSADVVHSFWVPSLAG
jgi:cytochrome c oxidase subunit 2